MLTQRTVSIMSDSRNALLNRLETLGLGHDEANIYLALLRDPSNHLRLSRELGIARTKVYRLVEQLKKRSLVVSRTDDRGTFLIAADPSTLEVALVTQEQVLQRRRTALRQALPELESLRATDSRLFEVRPYEGIEGLKQMCWHELKAEGELLGLGGQTIEDLIADHRWAEKHRALTVEADYHVREIINPEVDLPTFTNNPDYMERYEYRQLPQTMLNAYEQIIIYNDTVSVYHWREQQKVGVEIIGKSYSNTMRQIFEQYWALAEPATVKPHPALH